MAITGFWKWAAVAGIVVVMILNGLLVL
jgi:hypothetical protein